MKVFIWQLKDGGIVRKWGKEGLMFHAIIPTQYTFLMNVLLVKLKGLYISARLNLNYGMIK